MANTISFLAPDFSDKQDKGEPNFRELFVPFHEIAQINVAKKLYQNYGKHPELEKRLKKPNNKKGYFEADIVLGNKVWEVKPLFGQDPKAQLELYKEAGNLTEGEMLPSLSDITVFDDIKMEITFPEIGEARYQLYQQGDGNTRKNLSTIGAAIIVARALVKMFPAGKKLAPGW
jgi:hypothetical protein